MPTYADKNLRGHLVISICFIKPFHPHKSRVLVFLCTQVKQQAFKLLLRSTFKRVQLLCVANEHYIFQRSPSVILSAVEKPILLICFPAGQSMECSTLSYGSIREQFKFDFEFAYRSVPARIHFYLYGVNKRER